MARTRIISEEEEKQIVELYKSGISVNVLYRQYGYSWSVVKKVLAKYGVKERVYERKRRELSQEDIKQIIDLHNNCVGIGKIGKLTGQSQKTVQRVLKEYDIDTYQLRKKSVEESEPKARKPSEIPKGAPIDCDTEGEKCIYRATKAWHLCDYCALKGHSRGGNPHECVKYVFE